MNILLLTNRKSDNLGDQVMEACDISLIAAVIENIYTVPPSYTITSNEYITRNTFEQSPPIAASYEALVSGADLIILGGAPIFNFKYQKFYDTTALLLELAAKHHKPVIASAIGVEHYDEKKTRVLQSALNLGCVKQITTRDDLETLKKYIKNEQITIGKVSDPAVFSAKVFEPYIADRETSKAKGKIGVFVLRAGGFKDNGYALSKNEAAIFWTKLVRELESRGYEPELLTSGHCFDEAFLTYLAEQYGLPKHRCVFNMNTPEMLVRKISSYKAVISCRLHPSIISYALDTPSVGIVWNEKVRFFYDAIGYRHRAIGVDSLQPKIVADALEQAIAEEYKRDTDYMMSVYRTLFFGIKGLLQPNDSKTLPYSYDQLLLHLPPYGGTLKEEKRLKIGRKFSRLHLAKTLSVPDRPVQNYICRKCCGLLRRVLLCLPDRAVAWVFYRVYKLYNMYH